MAVYLEEEQIALFERLLEAWRETPRDNRGPFIYLVMQGGNIVQGNGLNMRTLDGDIEAIRREGLLTFNGDTFTITARNIAEYQSWKKSHVEPAADVEATIERYLASNQFRARYPIAYDRWKEAGVLLWGEDSEDGRRVVFQTAVVMFANNRTEHPGARTSARQDHHGDR